MKFLLFGGTGFIGRELRSYLLKFDNEVVAVSKSGRFGSLALDISDYEAFDRIDFIPDVIINCASIIPSEKRVAGSSEFVQELQDTNVIGALNICKWAKANQVPKLLNCSTLVVVGKPWPVPLLESSDKTPTGRHVEYAMSKLKQEKTMSDTLQGSSTDLMHLRLSAVYGDDMNPTGIIFSLLAKFKVNAPISLTNALITELNFIHVKDVCKAIYKISEVNIDSKIINLAGEDAISIMDLAILLRKLTGSNSEITNITTAKEHSKATVSIALLKKTIGEVHRSFIPLAEGLKSLIDTTES